MMRIFSDYYTVAEDFISFAAEGAALYYGLRTAFRRQIAEYFGEWSDRKSIRVAGRDEGKRVEWCRIAFSNIDRIDQRR